MRDYDNFKRPPYAISAHDYLPQYDPTTGIWSNPSALFWQNAANYKDTKFREHVAKEKNYSSLVEDTFAPYTANTEVVSMPANESGISDIRYSRSEYSGLTRYSKNGKYYLVVKVMLPSVKETDLQMAVLDGRKLEVEFKTTDLCSGLALSPNKTLIEFNTTKLGNSDKTYSVIKAKNSVCLKDGVLTVLLEESSNSYRQPVSIG